MQEKDGTKQAKKRRGTAEKREVEQQEEGKRQAHRAAGAKTTNERLKPERYMGEPRGSRKKKQLKTSRAP
jgi:hypothetical protein